MDSPSVYWSAEELANWSATRAAKRVLLMQHYGIDPNCDDAKGQLLSALEFAHVPGFRPSPALRGRPQKRASDELLYWQLLELLKRRHKHSERRASQVIASLGIVTGSAETLRTRHVKWKRKLENRLKVQWAEYISRTFGEVFAIRQFEEWVGNYIPRKPFPRKIIGAEMKQIVVKVVG